MSSRETTNDHGLCPTCGSVYPAGKAALAARTVDVLSGMSRREWPLRSDLELGALPTAVGCARGHAKELLWEWGLDALTETVELLVSEIVTNALHASTALAAQPYGSSAGVPSIRLVLRSDRRCVLIEVWDGNYRRPVRQNLELEGESGRGLLLVEALSAEWGAYAPAGWAGKAVWCVVEGPTPTPADDRPGKTS